MECVALRRTSGSRLRVDGACGDADVRVGFELGIAVKNGLQIHFETRVGEQIGVIRILRFIRINAGSKNKLRSSGIHYPASVLRAAAMFRSEVGAYYTLIHDRSISAWKPKSRVLNGYSTFEVVCWSSSRVSNAITLSSTLIYIWFPL